MKNNNEWISGTSPKMTNDRECGRSMVEMLGVLAIIGILSVTGIIGYTVAMRKYRANEIAQAISMLAVSAKTTNGGRGITETTLTDYTTLVEDAVVPTGVVSLGIKVAGTGFEVELKTNDTNLCQAVANIFGTSNRNPLYVDETTGNDCDANTLKVTTK